MTGARMTERELLECVRQAARVLGFATYHTHDSRRSEAGFPDLVITDGRRTLIRELKVRGQKPRPEQAEWIRMLDGSGIDVDVWTDADWSAGHIISELSRIASLRARRAA